MNFLQNYKNIFNFFFFIGFCPFTINHTNTVFHTIRHKLYAITYNLVINLLITALTMSAILFNNFSRAMTVTMIIAAIVENWIIILVTNYIYIMTIVKGKRHCQLISDLCKIDAAIDKLCIELDLQNHHQYRFFFQKITFIIVFCFTFGTIHVNAINLEPNNFRLIFFYVVTWLFIGQILFVVYVTMLAHVMIKQFHSLLIISKKTTSNKDFLRIFIIYQNLYETKEIFSQCFGSEILLSIGADFLLGTTVAFFIITLIIQSVTIIKLNQFAFCVLFIVPVVLKNVLLAVAIDRLEQQVINFINLMLPTT